MLTPADMRGAVASAIKFQIETLTHALVGNVISTPEREAGHRFERGLRATIDAEAIANTVIDRLDQEPK